MNEQNENHHNNSEALLISQLYSELYTQIIPQQGEQKPRRRRKKNKGVGENGMVGAKKRKLSDEQVQLLETYFGSEHKLESERKDRLATELGLDPRQVAVWFQNRRARWKNKKLEEEYSNLKKVHESVIIEKCRLETEILKLKDQLSEAEKEKQRLIMAERADGPVSQSPSPSLSMDAMDQTCFGEFGAMEEYENVFYMPENTYIYDMEWINPYI